MKQDYSRYSRKVQRTLKKADKAIYESSRSIRRTGKFLKNSNLENNLLISEAELAANH